MAAPLPPEVRQLLWDIEPAAVDADRHAALLFERVMTRGSLDAMRWLLASFPADSLRQYVEGPGTRSLPPREAAFWRTILGLDLSTTGTMTGGGRPAWAD